MQMIVKCVARTNNRIDLTFGSHMIFNLAKQFSVQFG